MYVFTNILSNKIYFLLKFFSPSDYADRKSFRYKCGEFYGGRDMYFECSPLKWKLYESVTSFFWCGKNTTSYILARPATNNIRGVYEYSAGICYDFYDNSIKTLCYTMSSKHVDNLVSAFLYKSL